MMDRREILRKRLRAIEAARVGLIDFTRLMMPAPDHPDDPDHSLYDPQKFHRVIGVGLEEIEARKFRRLMINVGPRMGKTTLASNMFPAWYIGKHPAKSIIVATYNEHYSWDLGRKIRDIMQLPQYRQVFPDLAIKKRASAVNRIETTDGGILFTVGRGSAITGRGADVILLDDPIKDRREADSVGIRDALWNWYTQVLRTRLMTRHGAIVIIQCMTGDTPVLMATGCEKPLRDIRPGDRVATYRDGLLSTSVVRHWRSNGLDNVFILKMTSGKTLKANERHPFLVCKNGEPKWIRVKDLTQGQEIFRVNGASGRVKPASGMGAKNPPNVEGFATVTMARNDGRMVFALRQLLSRNVIATLNIVTDYLLKNTRAFLPNRMVGVPFVGCLPNCMCPGAGEVYFSPIIATRRESLEDYFATTATSLSAMQTARPTHRPSPTTLDFTTDQIAEISPAGVEEIFDLQIEDTENFISNGYVSHNTRWTDDDLVGRLIDPLNPHYIHNEAKLWRKVDLPALAEPDDVLGRKVGEALWPDRFDAAYLEEIRASDPRGFMALYQGRPSPMEGAFFKADDLVTYKAMSEAPPREDLRFYGASDHAVSLGQYADKTCLMVVGVDTNDHIWIMPDVVWQKTDSNGAIEGMMALIEKYKPQCWWAESGQILKSIGPFLRKRMLEKHLFCMIEPVAPHRDKMQRAQAIQARSAMKMVHFPLWTRWFAEAQDQVLKFNGSNYKDDFVDTLSLIGLGLAKMRPRRTQHEKKPEIVPGTFAALWRGTRREERDDKLKKALQGWL